MKERGEERGGKEEGTSSTKKQEGRKRSGRSYRTSARKKQKKRKNREETRNTSRRNGDGSVREKKRGLPEREGGQDAADNPGPLLPCITQRLKLECDKPLGVGKRSRLFSTNQKGTAREKGRGV